MCGNSPSYAILKSITCEAADIARSESLDNQNNPCAALAVVIRFEAITAQLGRPVDSVDAGFPCGPGWKDSCIQ